jgi:hypothetical protein
VVVADHTLGRGLRTVAAHLAGDGLGTGGHIGSQRALESAVSGRAI